MSSHLDYNIAVVGEHLAKAIKRLVDNSWINASNIEMIGHGMGAYIAGLGMFTFQWNYDQFPIQKTCSFAAGRELDSRANLIIQKITALDPVNFINQIKPFSIPTPNDTLSFFLTGADFVWWWSNRYRAYIKKNGCKKCWSDSFKWLSARWFGKWKFIIE